MEVIKQFFQLIAGMKVTDVIDIAIVAILLYTLFPLLRSTNTMRIAGVIVTILVVAWLVDAAKLYTSSYIISGFLEVGLIAVVILFQPELRRMLDHLSSVRIKKLLGIEQKQQDMQPVIEQTVQACEVMSRERVGALIIFARETRLDEYFKTGTMIDAQVSEQLLRNIFFPKAALHDGALIVVNGRATTAGCVLPLSESSRLHADLGTRHRAGVGISEVSDAVAVIVSEESGVISVAVGGMLKRHLAPQMLERVLIRELCPDTPQEKENPIVRLRQKLQHKDKEERK